MSTSSASAAHLPRCEIFIVVCNEGGAARHVKIGADGRERALLSGGEGKIKEAAPTTVYSQLLHQYGYDT